MVEPLEPLVKLIAFYLPQFHPIPENDVWWGKGFTEWNNVVKARPRFPGHYQPHLPAELGFYDLRLPEVRQAQANLAREHGIHGFCYYHYWFQGRQLLERPFDEVLRSGQPDFPFCLCWANEPWTRTWDGNEQQVLLEQRYSEEDDLNHIRWLATAFRDRRYIRIEDKPLFLVYHTGALPDPLRTTTIWRREARRMGIGELYLCRVDRYAKPRGDPAEQGFDAAVEFQPDVTRVTGRWGMAMPHGRVWRRLDTWSVQAASALHRVGAVYDYATIARKMLQPRALPYTCYPCVTTAWDNTPRKPDRAFVIKGSTPALYEQWLSTVVDRAVAEGPEHRLVFVTAWNEWAEGNHLEPCQRWERGYLEATRRAVTRGSRGADGADRAVQEDHAGVAPPASSSQYR